MIDLSGCWPKTIAEIVRSIVEHSDEMPNKWHFVRIANHVSMRFFATLLRFIRPGLDLRIHIDSIEFEVVHHSSRIANRFIR